MNNDDLQRRVITDLGKKEVENHKRYKGTQQSVAAPLEIKDNTRDEVQKDKPKKEKPRYVPRYPHSLLHKKESGPVYLKVQTYDGETAIAFRDCDANHSYVFEEELTPGHYLIHVPSANFKCLDAHRDIEKPWMLHIYLSVKESLEYFKEIKVEVSYVVDQVPELDDIGLLRFHTMAPGREDKDSFVGNVLDLWRRSELSKYLYKNTTPGHYVLIVGVDSYEGVEVQRDSKKLWMLHVYLTRSQTLKWDRDALKEHIMYAIDHSSELKDIVLLRLHTFGPGLENEKGWLNTLKSRHWTRDGYATLDASKDENVWLYTTIEKLREHCEKHPSPMDIDFKQH